MGTESLPLREKDSGVDMIAALTAEAVRLGELPWELERSIRRLATYVDGDASLLTAARDRLRRQLIGGPASNAALIGLYLLRCAALETQMA